MGWASVQDERQSMIDALRAPGSASRDRETVLGGSPHFAALDLGTNNCRLLIATPTPRGFRVVEAYSRIVRLGEGLSQSGSLSEAAMDRALAALKVSGEKVRRRRVVKFRAIATQACRMAQNGAAFVQRAARETGVNLQIITPHEEAKLSVTGCLNLLDYRHDAALVVDVGGGSTELSWVDLTAGEAAAPPPMRAWLSVPIGVVTLAERFPEGDVPTDGWYRQMVDHVKEQIAAFRRADPMKPVFDADRAHMVGTSGAITSLAGMHLKLPRYDRNRVDGIWMTRQECDAAAAGLLALTASERAAQPCIGPDRSDLVLAGAAILQAVQELWPCNRVRVADRGLREGILLALMSERAQGRTRKRRRGRGGSRRTGSE